MIVKKWFEEATTVVKVLAVCGFIFVVFSLCFGLVALIKNGTSSMEGQVISVSKSIYDDYDDKLVDATDVQSAIKKYIDTNMAIVVANLSSQGGTFGTTSFTAPNYCVMVDQENNAGLPISTRSGSVATTKISYDEKDGHWYIGDSGSKGKFGLDWSGDAWLRNNNYQALSDSNAPQCYVGSGTKWRADILYDPTNDTACGIIFRQVQ